MSEDRANENKTKQIATFFAQFIFDLCQITYLVLLEAEEGLNKRQRLHINVAVDSIDDIISAMQIFALAGCVVVRHHAISVRYQTWGSD